MLSAISKSRGQIRPAILQNPGTDTYSSTEPLNHRKDALILLWPSNLVNMSFGKINLQGVFFLAPPKKLRVQDPMLTGLKFL